MQNNSIVGLRAFVLVILKGLATERPSDRPLDQGEPDSFGHGLDGHQHGTGRNATRTVDGSMLDMF